MDKAERRLVAWWAALVVVTLTSWEAGRLGAALAAAPVIAVLTLAFAKVAAVIMQYMDVRTAPWPLKLALCAWVVGAGGAVAALWLSAG
jgi:hypothetical protein